MTDTVTSMRRQIRQARSTSEMFPVSVDGILGLCSEVESLRAERDRAYKALSKTNNWEIIPGAENPRIKKRRKCLVCGAQHESIGQPAAIHHEPHCVVIEARRICGDQS